MNKVVLLGNLGADPELRMLPSGQAALKLRLATSHSYVDKTNERRELTEWHHVTIYGKRAEALAKYLTKGSRLVVEGRLHYFSTEKEGQRKYFTEVVATDVHFAGGGSRPQTNGLDALHAAGAPPPETTSADLDIPF